MDVTETNSRGKRGVLLERIDRQISRFRTAKTTIIKFGLHASFVELESAKSALNENPPEVMEVNIILADQTNGIREGFSQETLTKSK
ncbi:hypothetical protein TNCV_419311 [Trichonephila clavipes]|uniref:Uncharacterized protein n=1 Tax=Trichonephila clavipes TaxID=2585209 RepID=A0A8X6S4X6_TRICX|nr:hypothetical protein TNCV_419311 [Trichonephila clavipes]